MKDIKLQTNNNNEQDTSFVEEESILNLLDITTDTYTRKLEQIKISDIGFTEATKESRGKTLHGLTQNIKQFGVLEPIHVMTNEDGSTYKYTLMSGFRRIYGALRNGLDSIDAIIWDFKDKEKGLDSWHYLSLMLNVTQKRKWSEIWYLYQVLELKTGITHSTIEYLLQLDSEDAMRLENVMHCDYDDIKEGLLNDEMTLEKAYKTLVKYRKEEDLLSKEDSQGLSLGIDNVEDISVKPENKKNVELSDNDVKELLDMADTNLDNLEDLVDEDFDTLNKGIEGQQKVGERHPLDPALKNAVLARDNFRCQCCGFGGEAALGVLAVHHVLPVHTGGKDTMENLKTLCVNHHLLLHIAERNGGKLHMTKESFENNYTEAEQEALKKTLILARIAVEADKRKHLTIDDVKKATSDSIKHPMPGQGLKDMQDAYNKAQ